MSEERRVLENGSVTEVKVKGLGVRVSWAPPFLRSNNVFDDDLYIKKAAKVQLQTSNTITCYDFVALSG